jgi:hypothetical protein
LTKFQIELSDAAAAGIQGVIEDFNTQTGQSLTLEDWIVLVLCQKAVEKRLNAEVEIMKREHDAGLPRLIDARRRELLKEVGYPGAVRVSPDRTG